MNPTCDEVVKATAKEFLVRDADLQSRKRERRIARPRQVAQYLAYKLTDLTNSEIGRLIGGVDHSTVVYARKAVSGLMKRDTEFADRVRNLEANIFSLPVFRTTRKARQ